MPRLACFSCGRQIYTVAPLESLFAEERRCPRCGAFLNAERREVERRQTIRRVNPAHDPGPPKPKATRKANGKAKADPGTNGTAKADPEATATGERRVAERRTYRRRGSVSARAAAKADSVGWQD